MQGRAHSHQQLTWKVRYRLVAELVRHAYFYFRQHVQYIQFGEGYTGKTKWTGKVKLSFVLNAQVILHQNPNHSDREDLLEISPINKNINSVSTFCANLKAIHSLRAVL